ncbi:hypothetical protein BN946_scf184911.g111 [Trametes cinnabarina]|uniref:Uncharacterized protein n=1 Tax=Pycnoporus cinnabarinus TaxID=5643 RepID=A0A060SBA9_PYCCI|nr:hypothetical protein BN946_scf184911.g111 [Trametes cinnabarina]
MFVSKFLGAVVAVVFVGQVAASPMPMPLRRQVERREPSSFETIQAYRRLDINTVPAEFPTMSNNGDVVEFKNHHKRVELNTIPAEVPTTSSNGDVVEFKNHHKRVDINTIPAEFPTMSRNGDVVEFSNNHN